MNIVICGAGQVGGYAADVLAPAGHDITIIDTQQSLLRAISDRIDARTLCGNSASATVLEEAGAAGADLVLATTPADEVNLLTAAVAKALGASRVIARVHHRTFFEQRGFDYAAALGIDRLICPEYSTAQAIARELRTPGALVIENFAEGRIWMQEVEVSGSSPAAGHALSEVRFPPGARLLALGRGKDVALPTAGSRIDAGDTVVLVANADAFRKARKLFTDERTVRQQVVVMGGSSVGVWLCRGLRDKQFSIRLFEKDPARAESLAEELEWVTVLNADPTERSVFEGERLEQADAFVAATEDDEENILGSAWARSMGVKDAFAVVQRTRYMHLLKHVGIDRPFSPKRAAAEEILDVLDDEPLRRVASVAEGVLDVYRAKIPDSPELVGRSLRQIRALPGCVVAAIQHGKEVFVPGADDVLSASDTILFVGPAGVHTQLKRLFQKG